MRSGLPGIRPLNILGISLDRSLVTEGEAIGDNLWRQRRYAQALEHLWYIVYTGRGPGYAPRHLADNLVAYPTRSRARVLFPLDAFRLGYAIICRHRVDLITTQDPFATGLVGYWLKRRFGIPLSVMVFSSFFDNPEWLATGVEARLLHPLGKFIVRRADSIRVESPVERDRLIRLGISADRIRVIPLLVDLERFARADPAPARARLGHHPVVFYAGRLSAEKNLPLLLEAAARVALHRPDALFVLAGDGPQRPHLERLAAHLKLSSVRFLGVVPREELPAYFAACDLFVLPSRYEGIPTVLIEAAAAGKPVIATPLRNATDVMTPGDTGFIVERTAEALAERIIFLLDHPDTARAMGQRGRAKILCRYDPARIFADLLAMWRETATRRGAAP